MKGLSEQMQAMMKDQQVIRDRAMQPDMDDMQQQMGAMAKNMGRMLQAMEQLQKRMSVMPPEPAKP